MAIDKTKLTPASGQQNDSLPKVFVYETTDDKADVDDADYWADSRVRAGDWIFCSCADGGVLLYVSAASASASTVTKTTPA